MNWYELNSMASVYGWRAAVTASGRCLKHAGSPGRDRCNAAKCSLKSRPIHPVEHSLVGIELNARALLASKVCLRLEMKRDASARSCTHRGLYAVCHFSFISQHAIDCQGPLLAYTSTLPGDRAALAVRREPRVPGVAYPQWMSLAGARN